MPTYRIDQEPWIPCISVEGRQNQVSLSQVFSKAAEIESLAGSPLEVSAITRLLLAIAHLVKTPTSLADWRSIWEDRHTFMNRCSEYVDSHGDAWDLFHSSHPFGQQPKLGSTSNPAHILIYEAARKNNQLLIDHRTTADPQFVHAADLTRGIFTVNAFSGSSGGGYRSGPLAMRTVAFLQGSNLADTLLLNLCVQDEPPAAFDWTKYGHLSANSQKLDIVRRFLWTSRSIRLLADGDHPGATEIMLAPGNTLSDDDRLEDPMIVFRRSADGKEYVPLRLQLTRALWRSAHVLLNWHSDAKRLAAVDQLHRLLRRGYVPSDQFVSLRVCAVAGDAQGPATELWRDETLAAGMSVFQDDERFSALTNAVLSAENVAEGVRNKIYRFATSFLQGDSESAPNPKNVSSLVNELALDLMDFWSAIAPAGERIACDDFDELKWKELLGEAATKCFEQAVERLPPSARRYRAQFKPKEGKKDT